MFAYDDGAAHLLNSTRKDFARRSAHPVNQNGDRPGVRIRLWKNGEFHLTAAHLHCAEQAWLVTYSASDGCGDASNPARISAQVEDYPVGATEFGNCRFELFDHRGREDVEPDVADVTRSIRAIGGAIVRAIGDPLRLKLCVLRGEIPEPR